MHSFDFELDTDLPANVKEKIEAYNNLAKELNGVKKDMEDTVILYLKNKYILPGYMDYTTGLVSGPYELMYRDSNIDGKKFIKKVKVSIDLKEPKEEKKIDKLRASGLNVSALLESGSLSAEKANEIIDEILANKTSK